MNSNLLNIYYFQTKDSENVKCYIESQSIIKSKLEDKSLREADYIHQLKDAYNIIILNQQNIKSLLTYLFTKKKIHSGGVNINTSTKNMREIKELIRESTRYLERMSNSITNIRLNILNLKNSLFHTPTYITKKHKENMNILRNNDIATKTKKYFQGVGKMKGELERLLAKITYIQYLAFDKCEIESISSDTLAYMNQVWGTAIQDLGYIREVSQNNKEIFLIDNYTSYMDTSKVHIHIYIYIYISLGIIKINQRI